MRCERFWTYTLLLTIVACSRETPAPPPTVTTTQPAVTPSAAPPPPPQGTQAPIASTGGSYAKGIDWLRAAPAFHFVTDEAGVHAEGDLTRRTIGAESIQFRANGEEWRTSTGPMGLMWERRTGGAWKAATGPAYGNRLYQRVTLAFDPQKKEGEAQLVGTEDGANHYRFTNANTSEVHDVWVSIADDRIERVKIGDAFEMHVSRHGRPR